MVKKVRLFYNRVQFIRIFFNWESVIWLYKDISFNGWSKQVSQIRVTLSNTDEAVRMNWKTYDAYRWDAVYTIRVTVASTSLPLESASTNTEISEEKNEDS